MSASKMDPAKQDFMRRPTSPGGQRQVVAAMGHEQAGRDSGQSRSAAQDLVARRLRVLNKKLQRFRSYIGGSGLNDDQRAGISSIPSLEAATKELEDLGVGLEHLARLEEQKEYARQVEEETASQRRIQAALEKYKAESLPLLSSLLQLHGIIRPVGAVETHFMASDLPEFLQDLSRDDTGLVESLYQDLVAGNMENTLVRMRQLDEASNVRRVLYNLAKSSNLHSLSRRSPTDPEQGDSLAHDSIAEKGTTDPIDLVATTAERVRHPSDAVDQDLSDSRTGGAHGVKSQQIVYSFIQSSELSPLNSVEAEFSPEAPQPGLSIEPTENVKEQLNRNEPVSAILRPVLVWADEDVALPNELQLEHIRAQFDRPSAESSPSPASVQADIIGDTPISSETGMQEKPLEDDSRKMPREVIIANKGRNSQPETTTTGAAPFEVAVSDTTQQRRKPLHRPRQTTRVARPAINNQPNSVAQVSSIDHDRFQVATKRRGQGIHSVPGSPVPQGGAVPNHGKGAKGGSDRNRGMGAWKHTSADHKS